MRRSRASRRPWRPSRRPPRPTGAAWRASSRASFRSRTSTASSSGGTRLPSSASSWSATRKTPSASSRPRRSRTCSRRRTRPSLARSDQAESKLGKPVLFSSEEGMKALSAELAKTGLWESLGVDEKGSLLKQYEQEEVELCTDRLKEIEDERKRAVEAFAGTLGH